MKYDRCRECGRGLISVRMTKGRKGVPTFTLLCPEHGEVGRKKFKEATEWGRRRRVVNDLRTLFWWLLVAANADSTTPINIHVERLMERWAAGNLKCYVWYLLGFLSPQTGSLQGDCTLGDLIGRCPTCDATRLRVQGVVYTGCATPYGWECCAALGGALYDWGYVEESARITAAAACAIMEGAGAAP